MCKYFIFESGLPLSDITYPWENRSNPVWARYTMPYRVLAGLEYTVVRHTTGKPDAVIAKLDPVAGVWRVNPKVVD